MTQAQITGKRVFQCPLWCRENRLVSWLAKASRLLSFKNSTGRLFPELQIGDWQPHFEARPFGGGGSNDADLSPVDLDDSADDRET